jgi:peptidoglycan/LPS O-acetylase OafA/YrhL
MPEDKKLHCLESIRGLAALIVVANHLLLSFRPDVCDPHSPGAEHASLLIRLLVRSPLAFTWKGSFAVNVFFVLSGFVLSYSYFRTSRPNAVTAPALRRYFRLAIPSAISILGACTLMRLNAFDNVAAAKLNGSHWLGFWYRFTPVFWGINPDGVVYQALYGIFAGESVSYNNVLWTMRVELAGSFLVYGMLALFGQVRHRALLYTIVAILLLLVGGVVYVGFVIGMAGCDYYAHRDRAARAAIEIGWLGWIVLAAGLMLGGCQGLPLPVLHRVIPGSTYHQLIAAALVIAAPLLSATVRRPLDARPLAFLGRISFGLYLVHVPVICSLGAWIYLHLVLGGGWGLYTAAAIASLGCVVVSLILGWVMYHVADRPSIAIGKRVSDWFTGGESKPNVERRTLNVER